MINMTHVTISKSEYKRLKKLEEVDQTLLVKLVKSMEDIKAGRIKKFD